MSYAGQGSSPPPTPIGSTPHVKEVVNQDRESSYSWIAASGASSHICAERNAFQTFIAPPAKVVQGLGNKSVATYGQGTVIINSRVAEKTISIRLSGTLYVPEARDNIMSLGRIDAVGGQSICGDGAINIFDSHKRKVACGKRKHNLYYLDASTETTGDDTNIASQLKTHYTWAQWHRRLGHVGITGLTNLHHRDMVDGFNIADSPKEFDCEPCKMAKHTRTPLPNKASRLQYQPGELTHTDVWGPARVPSYQGYRYYISFIDDSSRHAVIRCMKSKDEAPTKVKQYLSYIERQGKLPKVVRADNGREYVNRDLITWCLDKGIELQTTAPYTPEQGDVAERWNRTAVDLGRAMILARNLPSELWPHAMQHATYVRNRVYTRALANVTPYQKWSGQRPDISHIQEFGTDVWILNEDQRASKLDPNSIKSVFVGYKDGSKAIRYYDEKAYSSVEVSRNYRFPLTNTPDLAPGCRFEGEQLNDVENKTDSSYKPQSGASQKDGTDNKKRKFVGGIHTMRNVRQRNEQTNEPLSVLDDVQDDAGSEARQMTSAGQVS